MTKDEVIALARQAGLSHFYDSEGHCTGVTDARLCEEEKERNDDRLAEILIGFAALVAAHKEKEMQERIDGLFALYEQACQQRDQLMDMQRAQIAAMRGKTQ